MKMTKPSSERRCTEPTRDHSCEMALCGNLLPCAEHPERCATCGWPKDNTRHNPGVAAWYAFDPNHPFASSLPSSTEREPERCTEMSLSTKEPCGKITPCPDHPARRNWHAIVGPNGVCDCGPKLTCAEKYAADFARTEEIATVVPNITGELAQVWLFGEVFITHTADVDEAFNLRDHINEAFAAWNRRAK